jgi:hypothetical protein
MKTILAAITITLIFGLTIIVGGLNIKTTAVKQASVYQLTTALELYYSDHDEYPGVVDGAALVNVLESEGYIKNPPTDSNIYQYELTDDGQKYILKSK